MRQLIFASCLLFGLHTTAAENKKILLMEVRFGQTNSDHKYLMTKTLGKNPSYSLFFKNEKGVSQQKSLGPRQAEIIRAEATQLIWENQYRSPSSMDVCHEYATIKTDQEKTKICLENRNATGKAFGFLNSLNGLF